MKRYLPRQGDFVVLSFDPQSGHEQKGRRSALVISKYPFHRSTGLMVVCPITNANRSSPFHVAVPQESRLTGFIMVEQIKSVDFHSRKARHIEAAPSNTLDEVLAILDAMLYR